MALVLEDGTGVEGANTYVLADDVRAYCAARGIDAGIALVSGVDSLDAFIIRACDWIESKRDQFNGFMVISTQELCFPRKGLLKGIFNSEYVFWDVIPPILIKAQCQLVIEQLNGVPLFASQAASQGSAVIPTGPNGVVSVIDPRIIIMDKIDVLETQWSDSQALGNLEPSLNEVERILDPLYINGGRYASGRV